MTKPTVIEEVSLNTVELQKQLEKIQKRDEELNFRAQKTLEYLQQVNKLKAKDAEGLLKELTDLNIPRLKESHIHKIIDVLPNTAELVKLLFQGQTISVSDDSAKKIAQVVVKFKK